MAAKILTISTKCGKIFTAREIAPEGHQNGGGCFPRSEGSELSFSPFKTMRGGDTYVRYVGRNANDNLITYRICRVVAKTFQQ